VGQLEAAANEDTVEDFMEAFHGFESAVPPQTPCRVLPPSRRSQSTEAKGIFQSPEETFEDFMEAFHGFESAVPPQTPCRVRPPSRRSQSAEARGIFQSPESSPRSQSVCSREVRVTRSGRRYGINR
jgi:hypothetical protein